MQNSAPKTIARVLPRDRRSLARRLHLLDRQGEWWSAVFMILCGLTLALPGDSFGPKYSVWAAFHAHGMTEAMWTCLFSGIGFARVVALVVNGYMQLVTPVVRMTAAYAGLMMWTGCVWLLWQGTPMHDGVVTLGFPLFVGLAAKEVCNIFLTAADVRIQP